MYIVWSGIGDNGDRLGENEFIWIIVDINCTLVYVVIVVSCTPLLPSEMPHDIPKVPTQKDYI